MGLEDYEAELATESRRQRAELRRHRVAEERDLVASIDRSRRLGDIAREALDDGATLEVHVGARTFAGRLHHVAEDLFTLVDPAANVVDVALSEVSALRVTGTRAAATDSPGGTHPASVRDCLVVLDALGAEVEVPAAPGRAVRGRIVSLGADHVVVRGGPATGDWVLATARLGYVLTPAGRGPGSAAAYLDTRRALFASGPDSL